MTNTVDSDIEHIWQTIWRLGFYRGGPVFMSALSGIDIALWDLKGRQTQKRLFVSLLMRRKLAAWVCQSTAC